MIWARLNNVNPFLYQWDTNQFLVLNGIKTLTYVYLAYNQEDSCLKLGPFIEKTSYVKIPDIFLQENKIAKVFVVENEENETNTTRLVLTFEIRFRPKPEDYVFKEEELVTWKKLDREILSIQKTLTQKANLDDLPTTLPNPFSLSFIDENDGVIETYNGVKPVEIKIGSSDNKPTEYVDKAFIHNQKTPSKEWLINHNLNKFPSVIVVDSANTVVMGEVNFIDKNSIKITFSSKFSGKAYLN